MKVETEGVSTRADLHCHGGVVWRGFGLHFLLLAFLQGACHFVANVVLVPCHEGLKRVGSLGHTLKDAITNVPNDVFYEISVEVIPVMALL